MNQSLLKLAILAIAAAPAWAYEDFKLPPGIEKLADRASETVDVTLDQSTLALASGFLSKDDPDEAQVKKTISKLKGISVRSFEFDKEGQYSNADVEAVRNELKGPNWSRIVGVKNIHGEHTEIYVLKNGDQIAGLVVLAAEPKELTIVHIDGSISPEELGRMGGHMGIPDWDKDDPKSKKHDDGSSQPKKDKDDDDSE